MIYRSIGSTNDQLFTSLNNSVILKQLEPINNNKLLSSSFERKQ